MFAENVLDYITKLFLRAWKMFILKDLCLQLFAIGNIVYFLSVHLSHSFILFIFHHGQYVGNRPLIICCKISFLKVHVGLVCKFWKLLKIHSSSKKLRLKEKRFFISANVYLIYNPDLDYALNSGIHNSSSSTSCATGVWSAICIQ